MQQTPERPAPRSNPAVTVLILNYNGAPVLPKCLNALALQTFRDFEILVVDNGSQDGSADRLEDLYPGIHVIRLPENTGFAAGNNIGARAARGRWLATLNNDAFPQGEWLANLVQAAETAEPAFKFFASFLLQANNPEIVDGTGDIVHCSGLAWHRDLRQPVQSAHSMPDEVFSPCAAAALYDRQAFLEAGGFDERYFSHHEDVDLGFRLRLLGYRCRFVPQAVVHHVGSASFGVESDFTIGQVSRNMIWTYIANMPGWLVWKYLPAHLLANLVFIGYYSWRGQARPVWRAKIEALRGLRLNLQKRRSIQANRQVAPAEIDRMLDRGWFSPYLLGRRGSRLNRLLGQRDK